MNKEWRYFEDYSFGPGCDNDFDLDVTYGADYVTIDAVSLYKDLKEYFKDTEFE